MLAAIAGVLSLPSDGCGRSDPAEAGVRPRNDTLLSMDEQAWNERHAALPAGWWVGSPSYHDERREWVMYAFDSSERPVVGIRKREWQAVAPTE